MDVFIGLLAALGAVGSLILLDVLAIRFGVDSRDPIGDDWSRPTLPVGSFPFWRLLL
jgi:hypothetical protein